MPSRGVYRPKGYQTGYVVKAKARLVVRGFSPVEGTDFEEMFSPTPSISSTRTLAAFACELGLPPYQLDAVQAFVQAN